MKKVLGVVLAGVLWFQALPAAALAGEANALTTLHFDQVKDEMLTRSPLIQSNWSKYHDGVDGADDLESVIKQQEGWLDASIAGIIQSYFTTQSLAKNEFTQRVSNQINLLPAEARPSLTALLNSSVLTGLADPVTALLSKDGTTVYGVATGKDSAGSNMWILVFPASPNTTLTVTTDVAGAEKVDIGSALDAVNLNLINLYETQINSLEAQLKSIHSQQDNSWKSLLQVAQGNDQIVWSVQQLFLTTANLEQQLNALQSQRALLQRQLDAAKLQVQLGLSTNVEQKSVASKLRDLDFSIKSLAENEDNLKGNLNVLLGQEYDTALKLGEISAPDDADIKNMDFDKDLQTAIDQSYAVRLAGDDAADSDNQKRTVKSAFAQAYKNVLNKQEALAIERAKLSDEREKLDQAELQYNLGLISTLAFEAAKLPYETQAAKVHTAEGEMLKAYTQYRWLLEGVNVTGNSATAGASMPAGQ